MIKINLLPWREELRKQKQKQFTNTFLAAILISGLIFAAVHFYFEYQQSVEVKRNAILQNEIVQLDKKIADIKNIEDKKKYLLNKVTVIHNLQRSRPEIVHLFNEIPRITPDLLFITKIKRTDRNLVIEGKSPSNALISAFMSGMEISPWMQKPVLDVIQAQDKPGVDKPANEKLQIFTLRTKQRDLVDPK